MFDVAQRGVLKELKYISELIGLFALNTLTKKFGKENIGLYRVDGFH
jgi:hypothetical protein